MGIIVLARTKSLAFGLSRPLRISSTSTVSAPRHSGSSQIASISSPVQPDGPGAAPLLSLSLISVARRAGSVVTAGVSGRAGAGPLALGWSRRSSAIVAPVTGCGSFWRSAFAARAMWPLFASATQRLTLWAIGSGSSSGSGCLDRSTFSSSTLCPRRIASKLVFRERSVRRTPPRRYRSAIPGSLRKSTSAESLP
jgi:hypothetical protein